MNDIDPRASGPIHVPTVRPRPSRSSGSAVGRLSPLALMLGLWSIAALLDLAIAVAGGATLATVARVGATYLCGFILSVAAYRSSARSVGEFATFSFFRIVVIAVPSGSILFVVDVFGRAFAHGQSPLHAWPTDYFLRLRPSWAYFTILFVFQSTVSWLTASAQALERHEKRLLEARLAALRLQLNPHFLFNTLNAIAGLVQRGAAVEAERTIDHLSNFLRVTLAIEAAALVPLASEIDLTQAYLDIEHVRFGDRLAIRYACDAGLSDALVPSLILQPLVENAIKHAVAPSTRPVLVSIVATADDDRLVLRVEDDGSAVQPSTSGTRIGLKNVASRLDALYGQDGRIETRRAANGFAAVLRLPLRFASSAAPATASIVGHDRQHDLGKPLSG